jgi:hypothetical protein
MAGNHGLAAGVPARLTAAEGRRFAFPVGIAFLALGGLFTWRGAATAALVVWSIGGLLLVAGLFVPSRLRPVEKAWMALAHAISKVTTPVILGILYFGVITPVGLLLRIFGHRPLRHHGESTWSVRPPGSRQSDLGRQF